MNKIVSTKHVTTVATGVSLCFMLIHLAMLALFGACGVEPMVRFNTFSILFYALSLALVHNKMFRAYTIAVFLEIVLHMTLAVLFVGWDAGFQITLIGVTSIAFFAEYLERSLNARHVSAFALGIVGMCAYLFSFEFVSMHPAPYSLPSEVQFWLQITWGVIVFAVTIMFLQLFVTVTFESEKIMSSQIAHDKLTGLPNRYHMSNHIRRLQEDYGQYNHWVAVADIDNFKHVNDTYGHNCGDFVLKEVAAILLENKGDAELCRWGGEEFLILGSTSGGLEQSVQQLDLMRQQIQDHNFLYEDLCLKLTITIGMAVYSEGMSTHEWIDTADKKLYEGKQNGKNQVVT